MMLVVNLCREKMHELEYVVPVCKILEDAGVEYEVKDYFRLRKSDLDVEKIILCGTSLKDFDYLKNLRAFSWMREYQGDVLGICAGAQLLARIFGGRVYPCREIGKTSVRLCRAWGGLEEEFFVYTLHGLAVKPPVGFEVVASSAECAQIFERVDAIGGRERVLLGVLFHPEVLQEDIIRRFAKRE